MKTQPFQVKVTKIENNKAFTSYLCNNRGKTVMCYATAQKWAETYRQRFIKTNHKFGEVLIQILPA